ncbi:MAG: hypothetical protein LUD48_01290, partial [Prevotella sp.]|nr:hypothetical protein [Prevotella sp.]
MKECPICHAQYDDSMNFCKKDGHRLETVSVSQSTGGVDKPQKDIPEKPVPKRKGGILKKIAIIVVVCLVVFAGVYNYLMNAATYLRLEPNALKATKSGGDCDVDIDYDGYVWEVKHKPDWVSIKKSDEKFNVEVKKNSTGSSREGSITIKSGKQVAQLAIGQLGVATYIKASETSMQFRRGGGKKNIGIETDGFDWKATDAPDWISVSEEKDSLCVECETNNGDYRSGYI